MANESTTTTSPSVSGATGATESTELQGSSGEELFTPGVGDDGAPQSGTSAPAGSNTGTTANTPPGAGSPSAAQPASSGATESGSGTAQPQLTNLTADDIAAILAKAGIGQSAGETGGGGAVQGGGAAPAASAPVQMTQEEFDRTFNVWNPSAELLAQLRNEDPNVATRALVALRDGLVKQVLTMSEYRLQQERSQWEQRLTPLQAHIENQQRLEFRNDFFKQNPELERYAAIVEAVATRLSQQQWSAKTRADVMKRYAEDTKQVLKSMGIDPSAAAGTPGAAGAASNGQGNTNAAGKTGAAGAAQRTGGRMSTLSGGGHGGGGAGSSAGGQKGPPGIEVFD